MGYIHIYAGLSSRFFLHGLFEFQAVNFGFIISLFTDKKESFLHFVAVQIAFETVILAYNHLLMTTLYIMYV